MNPHNVASHTDVLAADLARHNAGVRAARIAAAETVVEAARPGCVDCDAVFDPTESGWWLLTPGPGDLEPYYACPRHWRNFHKRARTRIRRRPVVAACGTESGYARHQRNGETPCGECSLAKSRGNARRHQARKAKSA